MLFARAAFQGTRRTDPSSAMQSVLMIPIRQISNRGSQIPEPLLMFTSKCPLKVQTSQGLGPFSQIELLKTDRTLSLSLSLSAYIYIYTYIYVYIHIQTYYSVVVLYVYIYIYVSVNSADQQFGASPRCVRAAAGERASRKANGLEA